MNPTPEGSPADRLIADRHIAADNTDARVAAKSEEKPIQQWTQDFIEEMRSWSPEREEIKRLQGELAAAKLQSMQDASKAMKLQKECDSLSVDLAAANQRIEELQKDVNRFRDLAYEGSEKISKAEAENARLRGLVEKYGAFESRLLSYFGNGGLFNPELMEHDKVRNLLSDFLDTIRETKAALTTPAKVH